MIMKKLLVTSSIIGFFVFLLVFSSPASISIINEKSTTNINDTTIVHCNIAKICCETTKCIKPCDPAKCIIVCDPAKCPKVCDPAKCPKICIKKCCEIDNK